MANFFKKTAQVLTGGLYNPNNSNSIKDFLGGKTASDSGFVAIPETAEQTAARREGLQAQLEAKNMLLNQGSVEDQALASQQAEQQQAMGGLGDVRRRVQQLMAQRGLKNTSVGLGAQLGAEGAVQERVQAINASLPERIRQLRAERAQQLGNLGAQMTGSAGTYNVTSNERQGGALPGLLSAGAKIIAGK